MYSFTYKETELREQGIDCGPYRHSCFAYDPNHLGAKVYLNQDTRLASSRKGVDFLVWIGSE